MSKIKTRVWKESVEVLCDPYSTFFNYILDIGGIPQQWKEGEITPFYEKPQSDEEFDVTLLSVQGL